MRTVSLPVARSCIRGVAQGHMDKFSTLYQELHGKLVRAVRRFVDNPVDVEDVVQEAYLKSLEREKTASIQNPEAYVSVAARNLALNYLRTAGARQFIELPEDLADESAYGSGNSEAGLDSDRKFKLYCEAVETLPTQCRKVFTLKHVYGYTQKEIAAYLKVTEKTVEYHVAQGLVRVRDFMNGAAKSDAQTSADASSGVRRA